MSSSVLNWGNVLLIRLGQLPLSPCGRPASPLDVWMFVTESNPGTLPAELRSRPGLDHDGD